MASGTRRRSALASWLVRLVGSAAFLSSAWPADAALRHGDLLVIANGAIEQVDPTNGQVTDFSPRTGSGTNLLSSPRDIASDPEGEIFVVDAGRLLRIDPATGAQQEVRAFNPQFLQDYPLDLGTSPWGVTTSPVAPSGLDGRDVFVGSHGALYRVTRNAFFGTGATLFATFQSGWENYEGQSVSLEDAGGGDVYAWVGTYGGILAGGASTLGSLFTDGSATILGTRVVGGVDYVSRVFGAFCTDAPQLNGVYAFAYNAVISGDLMSDFSYGGDLSCPGPIAASADGDFPLYVTDRGQTPNRIVKVTGPQGPQTSIVATMPGSQVIVGLAVYAPEPGAVARAVAACVVLAARGVRRRAARAQSKLVR